MMSRLVRGVSAAALLALGFAGCGGSSDDNTGLFVGTWLYASGVKTISCPNLGMNTVNLSGTLTISKGQEAPLVIIDGSCALKLDINGTAASLRSGQICPPFPAGSLDNGTAITETDTHQSGSFIVTGRTATLNESGSASLVFGSTEICSFTVTGATLNKP
jgi:hypothetical protein